MPKVERSSSGEALLGDAVTAHSLARRRHRWWSTPPADRDVCARSRTTRAADELARRSHRGRLPRRASRASRSSITSARSQPAHRMRVKARWPSPTTARTPSIDSVVPLWAGANWFEREVLGPVRHHVPRPPRSAAHPHVPGVRRPPAAQGLPQGAPPAARAPRSRTRCDAARSSMAEARKMVLGIRRRRRLSHDDRRTSCPPSR